MYKIELSKKAQKSLKNIPNFVIQGFQEKFKILMEDPYKMPGVDTIKDPNSIGIPFDTAYRIRVENYRAIYSIYEKEILIYVFDIEHRSKVYKKK